MELLGTAGVACPSGYFTILLGGHSMGKMTAAGSKAKGV